LFEAGVSREILGAIGPSVDRASHGFRAGDFSGAIAALDEATGIAGRLDATQSFLRLYQEAFLMRGLALERIDPAKGKQAYRDFIERCAGLAPYHPDTLRAVAWAREAVERLVPIPAEGVPAAAGETSPRERGVEPDGHRDPAQVLAAAGADAPARGA